MLCKDSNFCRIFAGADKSNTENHGRKIPLPVPGRTPGGGLHVAGDDRVAGLGDTQCGGHRRPRQGLRCRRSECRQPFVGTLAHGRRVRQPPRAVYRLHRGDMDQRLRPRPLDAKLHAHGCRRARVRARRFAVGHDRPAEPCGRRPLVGRTGPFRGHRRGAVACRKAPQDPFGDADAAHGAPRRLQRHRLQPPRQHDALHRDDVRHAAAGAHLVAGPRAARHPFPEGVPLRADADGRLRTARTLGTLRGVRRAGGCGRARRFRVEIAARTACKDDSGTPPSGVPLSSFVRKKWGK